MIYVDPPLNKTKNGCYSKLYNFNFYVDHHNKNIMLCFNKKDTYFLMFRVHNSMI